MSDDPTTDTTTATDIPIAEPITWQLAITNDDREWLGAKLRQLFDSEVNNRAPAPGVVSESYGDLSDEEISQVWRGVAERLTDHVQLISKGVE